MTLKPLKIPEKFRLFFAACSLLPACATVSCKNEGPAIEICVGNVEVHGFKCISAVGKRSIKEYDLMDTYVCTNPEDLEKEITYLKSRKSCRE